MSSINLLTKNIWKTLTKAVKDSKVKSIVAVAYFGQNGASMLPLSKGSTLLVDASMKAIKSGQTCPDELLNLYYKGVHIYSLENLHAKLFVVGNTLYCGSTNVSGNSASHLKETLLKTNDKNAVADAKVFIQSSCRIELGDEELKSLSKYYNPPKFLGVIKKKKKENIEFHVCHLHAEDWTKEEIAEAEKGMKAAEKSRTSSSRHSVDEFIIYKEIKFKKGDAILQITDEGNKIMVSPIGRLIHIRKWSNGSKICYFCFVEVPGKRRKRLEQVKKHLIDKDALKINRNGKKSGSLATIINGLWK